MAHSFYGFVLIFGVFLSLVLVVWQEMRQLSRHAPSKNTRTSTSGDRMITWSGYRREILAWCFLLAAVLALPFALNYGIGKEIDIELSNGEGQR